MCPGAAPCPGSTQVVDPGECVVEKMRAVLAGVSGQTGYGPSALSGFSSASIGL